jgi:hypothetical protein
VASGESAAKTKPNDSVSTRLWIAKSSTRCDLLGRLASLMSAHDVGDILDEQEAC